MSCAFFCNAKFPILWNLFPKRNKRPGFRLIRGVFWWVRVSTGHPHGNGFESPLRGKKNQVTTKVAT